MPTLVKAEQRSDEWFKARLGRATASKFSDIMAKTRSGYSASRKNYAAELVSERLTGQRNELYTTTAMQWGIDNEPLARLEYELAMNVTVDETGFWIHNELMAGASPDGFISDDGCLEIKCPNTATHIETLMKGKVPHQYWAQVQGQMWVTDRLWCDFVSYDPRLPVNAQKIIIHVERDDIYIAELEDEVEAFLEEVDKQVEFVKSYK